MLAYLFWHWPEEPAGYAEGLVAFHRALQASGVPGFVGSASYRVQGIPWLPEGRGYEDWYLVRGFADLESLNQAAVGPSLRVAHDRPALAAGGGMSGLYLVRSDDLALDASVAAWLSKPRGASYADFLAGLPRSQGLVQRQLVLGPGPEFCVLGETSGELVIRRERLV